MRWPERDVPEMAFDEQTDDQTLVQATLDGHRAAFDVIVERHRRSVYQVCFRFVGNRRNRYIEPGLRWYEPSCLLARN